MPASRAFCLWAYTVAFVGFNSRSVVRWRRSWSVQSHQYEVRICSWYSVGIFVGIVTNEWEILGYTRHM